MKGLLERFRGCLVGALLGDCLGAPFENELPDHQVAQEKYESRVSQLFDELSSTTRKKILPYTDDTAMTWDIAESLLDHGCFNPADMAKRFCETFYNHLMIKCDRGYGTNVVDVFANWKKVTSWNDVDPYAAAREQFGGRGSYGNGGAMRVSAIAFFAFNDYNRMLEIARKSALLTHTHRDGINGTILQCLSLYQILNREISEEASQIEAQSFADKLIDRMKPIESSQSEGDCSSMEVSHPYTCKLMLIKKYLSANVEVSNEEIVNTLGCYGFAISQSEFKSVQSNSVTAPKSVATALYCFLKNVTSEDQHSPVGRFEQTIRHAVLLGGDTDTIASMAGSLAGAYYGFDAIPLYLQRHCEGVKNALRLAERLYNVVPK